ncbi:MAG: hypothetical protein CXZ00_06875 [Acidobacteria bacterium]|nr:MAG: hypothetical protein CXZ00_06875 [Acidobacteriota bacterium]
MARNQESPYDDPFCRRGQAGRDSIADDVLPLNAGLAEDEQQFQRGRKRVAVRRVTVPRKTASRALKLALAVLLLAVLVAVVYNSYNFAVHSWRFRIRTEKDIELANDAPNSRARVLETMHESIGRNVFQISLARVKQDLQRISWVETASVSRIWPNHIRVMVKERTPVAFVAIGDRIELIDAQGVLMEVPPGTSSEYSFPVIRGMNESEPLSTRAPRMKSFMRLMRELDEGDDGKQTKMQYSHNVDEVDLSDPDDMKVMAKGGSGQILLHLGNENFLRRFMVFLSNVQKWEQERGKLESVDLRYGREIILNPYMHAPPPRPAPAVAKAPAPPKPEPAKAGKPRPQPHKKRK